MAHHLAQGGEHRKPQALGLGPGVFRRQDRCLQQLQQVVGYHLDPQPGSVGLVFPAGVDPRCQPALEGAVDMLDGPGLGPVPLQLFSSLLDGT